MRRVLLLAVAVLIVVALLVALWRWLSLLLSGQRRGIDLPPSATAWLLFLLPSPVALAAVVSLANGQLAALIGNGVGYGLFLGGALLVRRGLSSAGELSEEPWPVKTVGSGLVGLATGSVAWLGVGHDPTIAAAFALVALLGCYLLYGFDLRIERDDTGQPDPGKRTRATLAQAERSILAIEQASRDIRQAELDARLHRITELARAILRRLQEDPRDRQRARKFLNVYLDGVRSVVEGYAKTHAHVSAPELDERFRQVLITIEDAFREQQQALLESDVEDLDVRIEVLLQQLKREGII